MFRASVIVSKALAAISAWEMGVDMVRKLFSDEGESYAPKTDLLAGYDDQVC